MKGSHMTRIRMPIALATIVGLCVAAGFAPAAPAALASATAGVPNPLYFHGTVYRVLKVRTSQTIGSSFLKQRTSGVFVIVTIRLTNMKSRPSTILGDNLRILTRGKRTYTMTNKAFAVFSNGFSILEELQPRLPTEFRLVYELPKSALRGAKLQINDLGTGSKVAYGLAL
jgi:hypothetical protein